MCPLYLCSIRFARLLMPDSLARIVPGLDKLSGRAHVDGMAIEWIGWLGIWTARVEWAEIQVLWEDKQWIVRCASPPIRQGVGAGTLAQAQREALRLLENALWGPVKALIAAREAAK